LATPPFFYFLAKHFIINLEIIAKDWLNHRIRKVDAAGIITKYAGTTQGYSGNGGLAVNAQLNQPWYSVLDDSGNLYFAESGNNVIRIVDNSTGIIDNFCGTSVGSFSGDGGNCSVATLKTCVAVAFNADKSFMYIAGNSFQPSIGLKALVKISLFF
jgi:hypothetical protein